MGAIFDKNLQKEPMKVNNLIELVRHRALQQPNRRAYTFLADGETQRSNWTYGELDQKARAIAAYLQSVNAAGERALLLYPPGLEFIAAFFGCLYAGVVAVPAYPPKRNQKMSRLEAIATDAKAKLTLTTASLLNDIEARFAGESGLTGLQAIATDTIASDRNKLRKRFKPT